jgi:hypothetical protein
LFYAQAFFDNLGTILLYAVVVRAAGKPLLLLQGTTFNFLSLGGLLLGVAKLGAMGEMEPRLIMDNGTLHYVSNTTLNPVEVA